MARPLLAGAVLLVVALLAVLCTPTGSPAPSVSPDPSAPRADDVPRVERYAVFERAFQRASDAYANPWEDVRLRVELTSPSGRSARIGGFFAEPGTWKARFAPSELGRWSWTATLTDARGSEPFTGAFEVVPGAGRGFVRQSAANPQRWVFDDGSPYYLIGIGDCLLDVDSSGSPLDNWGLDGEFRTPGSHEIGRTVDMETYLGAYASAGLNIFRWSVDNCAFRLWESIHPGGNRYRVQEGLWGDALVTSLRRSGFRVYMAFFGFEPPLPNAAPGSPEMEAVKGYVRYVVDRYGAYVDFWELMNEARVPDRWTQEIASYLREIDPYGHSISTSWERPDLPAIEINSPHWYEKESELESDSLTAHRIAGWKAAGKPVIVGEQGNRGENWDDRSGLRMRLRSWTAFFSEAVLIFWNSSFAKDFRNPDAASIYLGPEERGYLRVLQDLTASVGADARTAAVELSEPARVRGYALRGSAENVAYLVAYTDRSAATSGIRLTLDVARAGIATWIDPAIGSVLATQPVAAGRQALAVPSFVTDIALRIR